MKTQTLTLSLIQSAQQGDPDSRSRLAELIRPKVYAYVYRMTLDTHVAEDLCQETMVSLIQNLQKLTVKAPSFLWAWVYKTALNKIRDDYDRQSVIQSGKIQMKQAMPQFLRDAQTMLTAPELVMRKELLTAVSKAITTLKLQYRNILILRCCQQLSYAEIAQVIGNSELGSRMLFFRAKRSLIQRLVRDGFEKSQLLPGLTLFAAATMAPVEKASAVAVSAAIIHTGIGIKLLTVLGTTKLGISVTAIFALSFISLGTFLIRDYGQGHRFRTVQSTEIAQAKLAYPVAIRKAYDPDQNGWQGALAREPHHNSVQITLDRWLVNPTSQEAIWLLLPKDHWIDVMFNGRIVDGEGVDILITERCRHGEKAEVYLVDDEGNTYALGTLEVPATGEHNPFSYGYDLSNMSEPFSATTIRIRCTHNGSKEKEFVDSLPGMELQHVRARVQD